MIEQSESIANLATALSKAQAAIDTVNKGRTANLPSKDPTKKGYSYNYADLSDIMEAVSPVLAQHGLSVTQFPSLSVGGQSLVTQVMHESGEWIRGEMELPVGPGVTAQALGSAITYCRRYAFSASLGIVTDTDDDGKKATENRGGETTRRPAPSRPGAKASESQVGFIKGLLTDLGVPIDDEGTHRAYIAAVLDLPETPQHVSDLTGGREGQASTLIEELKRRAAEGISYEVQAY